MQFSNTQIAEYLTNIATALVIKKENRFRIVSYQNAADTIISYPESVYDLWKKDPKSLDEIPHIGPAIFDKITHLFKTGKPHPHVLEYEQGIAPAVFTFTKINSIGPLIADKLTKNLKFSKDPTKALHQLVKYCQTGKVKIIPTLGEKSEESILENTQAFLSRTTRMPLETAELLANHILNYMRSKFPHVEFIALGSLRRQSATVGDIDIAAASTKVQPILDYFVDYPDAVQTIVEGQDKASIRLLHDVRVDLMVKPKKSFGSLLQHFTGSRQHNINLRKYALKLGFSVSDYGIKDLKNGEMHEFDSEIKFYNFLKLDYIEPIDRLGEAEIETHKMV